MPRFFFNVHDGAEYPDLLGRELVDLDAARHEALRSAAEMLRLEPHRFWSAGEWAMDVLDDAGLLVFTLRFGVEEQPSTRREPYIDKSVEGKSMTRRRDSTR